MSTTNGTYLTEDDKKKLEEGVTTPSSTETPTTTPTTGTTGTTGTPMTYSQFVGTGVNSEAYNSGVNYYENVFKNQQANIERQQQAGHEYAQGVKDSTIGASQAQRDETHRQTDIAKERSIVDARSDYQKAVGAYGSNAESLASGGLGGSGYGEWLQGNAYATMRGNVQNAQANALAQKNAADYAHNQNVLAAEGEYTKNIYGIDSQAMKDLADAQATKDKGIYELGVGLSAGQADAYTSLMAGATSGASLESIMNDARWGDLTPEQQQAITNAATEFADKAAKGESGEQDANYLGLLTDINSGALTIDAIKQTSVWETLTPQQQAQLESAAALKGKTDMKDRMSVYENLAASGTSLEDIKTMMAINGDKYVEELTPEEYEKLSDEEKAEYDEARNFMKLIESAIEKYTNQNTTNETLTNIDNAIADGATLEEIQSMPGYENLDPEVQEQIREQVAARDEAAEVEVDAVVTKMVMQGAMNTQDINDNLAVNKVPESMRAEIISKYHGEMASRTIASINDGSAFNGENALTGAALVENIKNGVYGDKASDVVQSYYTNRIKEIGGDDIVAIVNLANDIDTLSEYLTPAQIGRLDSMLSKALKTVPPSKYSLTVPAGAIDKSDKNKTDLTVNNIPYKVSGEISNAAVLSALSIATDNTDMQVLQVGKTVYLRRGDKWYECPEDYTRPVALTNSSLASADVKTGSVNVKTQYITGIKTRDINGKIIGSAGTADSKTSNALNNKYGDMPAGSYVLVNNRIYVKEADGSWTFSYYE